MFCFREVTGKIVQIFWKGFSQVGKQEVKAVVQQKKTALITIEIEGDNHNNVRIENL